MDTTIFKKISDTFAKNSPTILTGVGVAGLVTTTIMAVKATPKALQILEDEEYERSKQEVPQPSELTKKEIVMLTWKCYIPAMATGAITVACIIGANSINTRRNAALAGLYSLSEAAMKEYQSKVVETIGKNKEQKIKDEIIKDRVINNPVNEDMIEFTGKGDTLCYDALSGRYFKSDIEHIRSVMNDLSRNLLSDMFITLNEVYYALDLPGTKMGDLVGWHVDDGLIDPDFSSQLTEKGIPCLVLDFKIEPRYSDCGV